MKKKFSILVLTGALLLTGGIASAGTSYVTYYAYVPGFNGSAFTEDTQTKTYGSRSANLRVDRLGKAMDARLFATQHRGPWHRITKDTTYSLSNSTPAGTLTSVEFSNDLTTPVTVFVGGVWRSN